jgi:hypothetical protein
MFNLRKILSPPTLKGFRFSVDVMITDCNLHFPKGNPSVVLIAAVDILVNDLLVIVSPETIVPGEMAFFLLSGTPLIPQK